MPSTESAAAIFEPNVYYTHENTYVRKAHKRYAAAEGPQKMRLIPTRDKIASSYIALFLAGSQTCLATAPLVEPEPCSHRSLITQGTLGGGHRITKLSANTTINTTLDRHVTHTHTYWLTFTNIHPPHPFHSSPMRKNSFSSKMRYQVLPL